MKIARPISAQFGEGDLDAAHYGESFVPMSGTE
jgi:hypothetical protein